jgi:hypothetical protein
MYKYSKIEQDTSKHASPENRAKYVQNANALRATAITVPKVMGQNYGIREPGISQNVLSYLTGDEQKSMTLAQRGQNLVTNMEENRLSNTGGKKTKKKQRKTRKIKAKKQRKTRK